MQRSTLLCVAALCAVVVVVNATSDADARYIYLCDAESKLFGCEPTQWVSNNRLNCRNKTNIMNWATRPVRSDCFQIIAGNPKAPQTTYTPDELMYIHIQVGCYRLAYRGLMTYAEENANGTKVGQWFLSNDLPALFTLPWTDDTHSCHQTLMHAGGVEKPYHASVQFKAPPAGTGSITFRALFKSGVANTGDFWWPAADLVLNEGPVVKDANSAWVRSQTGESCSEACANQLTGMTCDEKAFAQLNTPESFETSPVPRNFVCKLPYLSGCGAEAGAFDPVDQWCYYVDSAANCDGRDTAPLTCSTKSADLQRFCPCSTGLEGEMSGASSTSSSLFRTLLLLPLLFLFSGNRQVAAIFGALLLIAAASSPVHAHNWLNSKSRSLAAASTLAPCKSPLLPLPHVELGPGQTFSIEWMNGHGYETYFAIIRAEDADKLNLHNPTLLEDYLNSAPNTSNVAQTPKWMKYHRKPTNNLDNDYSVDVNVTNYFKRIVNNTDPYWIPRPTPINSTDFNRVLYQMEYFPGQIAMDKRVTYTNAKYPWIISLHKFYITTLAAGRFDTALFQIPAGSPSGKYIVHYYWRGYRDCVDIDYKAAPVTQTYGYMPPEPQWSRIDHCLFEEPLALYDFSEIVTDAQYCLDRCYASGGCHGVNIVPLMAPSSAYQNFKPKNNPWGALYPNVYGADIYVPWNHTSSPFVSRPYLRDALMASPSPDKYICYTLAARIATNTDEEYRISLDPLDPIFYSTCYFKLPVAMFNDYANGFDKPKVNVPWRYNEMCLDCKQRSVNEYPNLNNPKWSLSNKCVNCDKHPSVMPPLTFEKPVLIESSVRCDGVDNNTYARPLTHTNNCTNASLTCHKPMIPSGRLPTSVISLEDCRAMVLRDPECTDRFTYITTTPRLGRCQCVTKDPCCIECSRQPTSTSYSVYEVGTTADPTCARGVPSLDNTACCTSNCKNCTVLATTTTVMNDPGFCCANCIKNRPCSQFGPPCTL